MNIKLSLLIIFAAGSINAEIRKDLLKAKNEAKTQQAELRTEIQTIIANFNSKTENEIAPKDAKLASLYVRMALIDPLLDCLNRSQNNADNGTANECLDKIVSNRLYQIEKSLPPHQKEIAMTLEEASTIQNMINKAQN